MLSWCSAASFVSLEDAAALTAKAILDPRTLNKVVQIRPRGHHLTQPELIALWRGISGEAVSQHPIASLVDSISGVEVLSV